MHPKYPPESKTRDVMRIFQVRSQDWSMAFWRVAKPSCRPWQLDIYNCSFFGVVIPDLLPTIFSTCLVCVRNQPFLFVPSDIMCTYLHIISYNTICNTIYITMIMSIGIYDNHNSSKDLNIEIHQLWPCHEALIMISLFVFACVAIELIARDDDLRDPQVRWVDWTWRRGISFETVSIQTALRGFYDMVLL